VGESVLTAAGRDGGGAGRLPLEPPRSGGWWDRAARGRAARRGRTVAEIAARYGTPTYVYNADVIRRQYRALDAALAGTPHQICFAVKANGNLA
jgi:hypothetical protein